MSSFCARFKGSCYGVEVLNEPQNEISHEYLDEYYSSAIAAVEAEGLPPSSELVLFSWTYDFDKWKARVWGRKIVWDTHVGQANGLTRVNHVMHLQLKIHTGTSRSIILERPTSRRPKGRPKATLTTFGILALQLMNNTKAALSSLESTRLLALIRRIRIGLGGMCIHGQPVLG